MANYKQSPLFSVINTAVMEKKPDEPQSESQPSVGLAAAFENPSSQSPSTLPADPSARVLRKETPTVPGGLFKPKPQSSQGGGKSRRHRRARRTIKKSRKVRKMRRSYK